MRTSIPAVVLILICGAGRAEAQDPPPRIAVGFGVGSLALLMLQHLSGGAWGLVIRRILEASTRTIPVMGILGLPILAGMGHLYHWTTPQGAADDMVIVKAAYLNTEFFIVRYVAFFAIWSFMTWRLSALSAEQDRTGDPGQGFVEPSGGGHAAETIHVRHRLDDVFAGLLGPLSPAR